MKRIVCIVLTAVMLLALCSCGFLKPQGTTDPTQGTTTQPTQGTTTQPTQDIIEDGKSFSRGVWTDNVYTNEFAELSFTLPDGWVAASEEEMAQLMGVTAEMLEGANLDSALATLQIIYDMQVTDATTRDNINIIFENLARSNSSDITEEEYLEFSKNSMSGMTNLDYSFGDDIGKQTLGGNEYFYVDAHVTANGVEIYQRIFVKKIDKYMVNITVTNIGSEDFDDIIANFS